MLRASMLMAFNHEDHEALALKHSIMKYEAFNRDLRDKMLRASMLMAFNHKDHEALALKHSITKYEAFNRDLCD